MSVLNSVSAVEALVNELGLKVAWISMVKRLSIDLDPDDLSGLRKSSEFYNSRDLPSNPLAGLTFQDISVLYEFSLSLNNRAQRKELGQYFTPLDAADFMAGFAADFPEGVWLDPCSSLGSLTFALVKKFPNPYEFLKNNVRLLDLDSLALLIGRALFSLFFLERNIFKALEKSFIQCDFLDNLPELTFDYVIANPPYSITEKRSDFESGASRDLYAYFFERIAKMSRGFVLVTPQSFTNGRKFVGLRRVLVRETKNLKIFCFDNVPDTFFRGYKFGSSNTNTVNSTRAAVSVCNPKEKEPGLFITPLIRWRSNERDQVFVRASELLTEIPKYAEKFPKISSSLLELYNEVMLWPRLTSLTSQSESSFFLNVPSTPRYFISATKRELKRSSIRQIYFVSEEARDYAYLALNSSLTYWWWRVNDGGMTLSEETLMSTPLPPTLHQALPLVPLIEASEGKSVVIKRNSGKDNENIKHDLGVISRLNQALLPKYAEALLAEHRNSSLT